MLINFANDFMTSNKFKLLAGPCVIESEANVMLLAEAINKI